MTAAAEKGDPDYNEILGRLANLENAASNADILHKQSLVAVQSLQPRLAAIERRFNETAAADNNARLAALEAAALTRQWDVSGNFNPPVFQSGRSDWKALLAAHKPQLFESWLRSYEMALPHYNKSIEGSCSTWNNRFAVAFRDYLKLYARGYVLDVGSGTLSMPVYLAGYPESRARGLEPRPIDGKTDLQIMCGVNEFIPFADDSFQTVCNATSLDHVIDLDTALAETARVLSDDGLFVVWYAHVPDAAPPSDKPRVNDRGEEAGVDEFHLFHINDDWFLPMIERHFRVIDRRVYPVGSFSHVFAAYAPH